MDITWKLIKNGTKSAYMNNTLGFDKSSFWDKNHSHFGIRKYLTFWDLSCVCVCKPCTNLEDAKLSVDSGTSVVLELEAQTIRFKMNKHV